MKTDRHSERDRADERKRTKNTKPVAVSKQLQLFINQISVTIFVFSTEARYLLGLQQDVEDTKQETSQHKCTLYIDPIMIQA